jgi:hypothetical protein
MNNAKYFEVSGIWPSKTELSAMRKSRAAQEGPTSKANARVLYLDGNSTPE